MMGKKYIIGIALLATWALPSFSQVSNDNEDRVNKIDARGAKSDFVPGQILVKFKDAKPVAVKRAQGHFFTTSIDKVTAVLQKYGADEMEQLLPNENSHRQMRRVRAYNGEMIQERDLSQLYCLKLSAEHQNETMQMVEELNALDEVEYAEPNYYYYIMGGEKIAESYGANPMAGQQWYLNAYGVTELWDKDIRNSERPVIAIIDTGVDTTHPDLKDNCIEGYDFVNNTANVIDDNMHGTHVAGIAAACNNETGIVGANPQALIMPIKVLDKFGKGDGATVLRGVAYAVEHGAKILNLSLGGYGYSKAAADVYRNASTHAIIVAAAGNDGKCLYASHEGLLKHGNQPAPSFPGAYSFVLGVQATDRTGRLASFSNYDDDGPLYSCETSLDEPDGFNYELKAPGTEIYSTLPGGSYGELQGTSMASPLVAGAISALMMVKDYETQEQLWAELLHTNNIAEAYELTELPADLDVVRIMLRERKEFSDETAEAYSGINEVNAGETIDIYPVIRCTSGEAQNIQLKIETDDNEDPDVVQIITGEAGFGWHLDAMGKAVSKNPLVIKIPNDIADARRIRMKITVSSENQEGSNSRPFTFIANNMETISGLISENSTLYSGHTYYANDNVIVNKNITLTIEPGARLEFAMNKGIFSWGKLIAKGTPEKPIILTSHKGGDIWNGISTRKKTGRNSSATSLYMNSDTTLFTIYPTEATPINVSNGFRKTPYYNPTDYVAENKTFYLKDYMEGWDETDNLNGKEEFLTDPNFITSAVLRMLEDYKAYCAQFGSGERTQTNTKWVDIRALPLYWTTYEDYGDTISYCKIERSKMECDWNNYDYPYMENCIITGGTYREAFYGMSGILNVLTDNIGYERGVLDWKKKERWIIVNNTHAIYKSGKGNLCKYSQLNNCNFFNNPAILSEGNNKEKEYWLGINSSAPEVDHAFYPSYLGTCREDLVRPHVFELGNAPGSTWGTIDLSNMRTTPIPDTHGIIWKVMVNGKDAQDEYDELAPLGVGQHKFEVYFNRPMNKEVIPQISFGVRDPWTQNAVDEDGSWNEEGTIYTAYKTISGKTGSDGMNRIYVRGAEDDEYFPCPYEKSRFNINIQAAGSMATGFAAEAGLAHVTLTWNNEGNDIEDAMGYNVYRYCKEEGKDTIRINENILDIETNNFVDCDVIPNRTYYYYYKVLSTDLKEYDVSNVVAATPMTALLGDANGNGDVDVADVITIVNYASEMKPKPFVFEAADINGDNTIDILDIIGVINMILYPEAGTRAMATATATYTVEDGTVYVDSPVALAGIQLQIATDKSQGIRATNELKGFEQVSAWLSDNDCLLLAYSMNGKMIEPGKHPLLHIGDAKIVSMRLSDSMGNNVTPVSGDGTTAVSRMGKDVMTIEGIYNLKGQKIATGHHDALESLKKLPKGIYIIDGKKVVK